MMSLRAGLLGRQRGRSSGRSASRVRRLDRLLLEQLHVEREALELLDEHVEALRQAALEGVVTLYDGLVHARGADHVVALDGEELLQRVRRTVGLHGPHFHLTEPLPAE